MDMLGLALNKGINLNTHKIVLSDPIGRYRKIQINKKENGFFAEKFTDTQVFHETVSFNDVLEFIRDALKVDFRQLSAWDDDNEHSVKITKRGTVLYNKRATKTPPAAHGHNREKNYILRENTSIPPLVDMGIFTKEGKVVKSMYNKFRQINRFIEIVDDEVSKLPSNKEITVIDFGCGKSYLTFVLYYYFAYVKKMTVHMTGLDLKQQVIENCAAAAKKYGYDNLHFELGDIESYNSGAPVDMVISLHACDTATDFALYNAVCRGARLIFSVPCCQHEVNSSIASDDLSLITKYGIIKERTAALLTDAIRANMLEYAGYSTQLLEFIDFEHTPKNILIRAKKTNISHEKRQKALAEVERINAAFSLTPTLYTLLYGENK